MTRNVTLAGGTQSESRNCNFVGGQSPGVRHAERNETMKPFALQVAKVVSLLMLTLGLAFPGQQGADDTTIAALDHTEDKTETQVRPLVRAALRCSTARNK